MTMNGTVGIATAVSPLRRLAEQRWGWRVLSLLVITAAFWVAATLLPSNVSRAAEDAPTVNILKLATLKIGTVNWELETITSQGLDSANGITLEVIGMADNAATRIAFEGGAADAMVADWIWVARQRAAGRDYVFLPYSKAVGGLVVAGDGPVRELPDLKGHKIAIAGGPLDKSWLLLRAYAEKRYGMNLAAETEQVFGAPPLVYKSALDGDSDGAINFWHFLAKMKAAGMRELVSTAEASRALGLDPETPLLGYVFHGEMVRNNPQLIAGFARASRAAKDLLAEDDSAWQRLRPIMNAKTDSQFAALVAGFREGIPAAAPIDLEAADRLLQLMAELGGSDLVGDAQRLPEGLFIDLDK